MESTYVIPDSLKIRNKSIKILIVDDDQDARFILKRALDSWHYDATAVSSCEEAVELIEEEKQDLIILDLGMPGMSGQEFLDLFRRTDKKTDVIVLSGLGDESLENKIRSEEKAYTFLEKPVPTHVLQKYVDMLAINVVQKRSIERKKETETDKDKKKVSFLNLSLRDKKVLYGIALFFSILIALIIVAIL